MKSSYSIRLFVLLLGLALTACGPASVDSYSQTDTSATSSNSSYSQRTEERKSQDSENNFSYSYSDNNQQAQAESNSKAEDTDSTNNNNSGLGRFILLFTMFCLLVGVGGIFLIEKLATSPGSAKGYPSNNPLSIFSRKRNTSKYSSSSRIETLPYYGEQDYRVPKLEKDVQGLKAQLHRLEQRLNKLENTEKKLRHSTANLHITPQNIQQYSEVTKAPVHAPNAYQLAIDAFNRLDDNFFTQKKRYLLTLSKQTLDGQTDTSGKRVVIFQSASNDHDASFFAVQLENYQEIFLFPNFFSPYYLQGHWLSGNDDIFQYHGDGSRIQLEQPALVEFSQNQWYLVQAGSCYFV